MEGFQSLLLFVLLSDREENDFGISLLKKICCKFVSETLHIRGFGTLSYLFSLVGARWS